MWLNGGNAQCILCLDYDDDDKGTLWQLGAAHVSINIYTERQSRPWNAINV